MKEMQFTIEINAPKMRVWETLWQDKTLREWAGIIDPGTYMSGELEKGNQVQFISSENGYGVTSLVEEIIPGELLILKHLADTQEHGEMNRDQEWSGGKEQYILLEASGITKLTVQFGVPPEMESYFKSNYPKALDKVKQLAEE